MKQHQKRWLISRMKTSGSKRRYLYAHGTYADERHQKQRIALDELPTKASFHRTPEFYNGKINYSLLARFIRGQVGRNWTEVHSEILARIPTQLLRYKDMIHWYVADQVELSEGAIWNKRSQRFIGTQPIRQHFAEESTEFYVHPQTKILTRCRPQ